MKKNKLFTINNCIALYDSGIHYVDQFIEGIINKSKKISIYDNLMLIVVSDHGEHFAEHYPARFYNHHGRDYFEEFIKVPLIIKYPYIFKRGLVNHPVSLIDVFPTILDFYNIEIPAFVQGESLLKPFSKRKRKYIVSEAVSQRKFERKMIRISPTLHEIK